MSSGAREITSTYSSGFAFSVALQTFAVFGVNTALIQAVVMARGKVHVVLPGKLAIRADFPNGNVKLEVLPAAVPDHIAAIR